MKPIDTYMLYFCLIANFTVLISMYFTRVDVGIVSLVYLNALVLLRHIYIFSTMDDNEETESL